MYSVLDTVVIFCEDVCCSVVFGTLVGIFMFSVKWFRVADDIYYYLSSIVIGVRELPVVAMTVMRVLLFVLHVCMLRECNSDGNAGVGL